MASKWEKQVLGGMGLIVFAIVFGVFASQFPEPFNSLGLISLITGIFGAGIAFYGFKTKMKYG